MEIYTLDCPQCYFTRAISESRVLGIALGFAGLLLHGAFLYLELFTAGGLNLSFFNAVSLAAWTMAGLLLISALSKPVENLAILALPLAGQAAPEEVQIQTVDIAGGVYMLVGQGGNIGVSVGEEDHVRIAIEELGSISMWRLRIKPGKPLVLGRVEGTPIIGLPGNPVSAFVTCLLFVRPFLLKMQGLSDVLPASYPELFSQRQVDQLLAGALRGLHETLIARRQGASCSHSASPGNAG